MTEWQRLMRRWDVAYSEYTSVCGKSNGQSGSPINDWTIEQAKLRLVEIKNEIDRIIARSVERRRGSPDALQFAVIETKMANLHGASQTPAGELKAQEPFKNRNR
jgi:hypothetical protein